MACRDLWPYMAVATAATAAAAGSIFTSAIFCYIPSLNAVTVWGSTSTPASYYVGSGALPIPVGIVFDQAPSTLLQLASCSIQQSSLAVPVLLCAVVPSLPVPTPAFRLIKDLCSLLGHCARPIRANQAICASDAVRGVVPCTLFNFKPAGGLAGESPAVCALPMVDDQLPYCIACRLCMA